MRQKVPSAMRGWDGNRIPYDFTESVANPTLIWHIKGSGGAAGKRMRV
jgi:hypothetical protein